jgi:hypothetical protein
MLCNNILFNFFNSVSYSNQTFSFLVLAKMAEEISNLKDDRSVCNDSSEDETDGAGVDCGLSLGKLNLGHRKKLLVLGLGGLLCHRVYRRD